MSDKKEQLGLRVSAETKNAYSAFCVEKNCSQGEGLALLLQDQKLREAEKANPELAANLSAFRHCVEELIALQEASLVIADKAAAKAREEFATQLDNNAQLIHVLQGRVTAQEKELSNAQAATAVANEEFSALKQKYGELDERYAYAQHQLSERAQRISALEGDLEASRGLPSRYQELLEKVTSLQAENRDLSDRLKDAALSHSEGMNRLREEKHQVELELAALRSVKCSS